MKYSSLTEHQQLKYRQILLEGIRRQKDNYKIMDYLHAFFALTNPAVPDNQDWPWLVEITK